MERNGRFGQISGLSFQERGVGILNFSPILISVLGKFVSDGGRSIRWRNHRNRGAQGKDVKVDTRVGSGRDGGNSQGGEVLHHSLQMLLIGGNNGISAGIGHNDVGECGNGGHRR